MYAKIACERILIRTDRMDNYLTQDILQSQWTEKILGHEVKGSYMYMRNRL